jgi:hypothetical protein
VFFGIPDDEKSPEKFCEFCTTYTIVRILSSLYERKCSKDDNVDDNNNVTCIIIAKQRLSNQASTVERLCSLWDLLWCNKHTSTTEAVFPAWSVRRSYLENNWHYKAVEGTVVGCSLAGSGSGRIFIAFS